MGLEILKISEFDANTARLREIEGKTVLILFAFIKRELT